MPKAVKSPSRKKRYYDWDKMMGKKGWQTYHSVKDYSGNDSSFAQLWYQRARTVGAAVKVHLGVGLVKVLVEQPPNTFKGSGRSHRRFYLYEITTGVVGVKAGDAYERVYVWGTSQVEAVGLFKGKYPNKEAKRVTELIRSTMKEPIVTSLSHKGWKV